MKLAVWEWKTVLKPSIRGLFPTPECFQNRSWAYVNGLSDRWQQDALSGRMYYPDRFCPFTFGDQDGYTFVLSLCEGSVGTGI